MALNSRMTAAGYTQDSTGKLVKKPIVSAPKVTTSNVTSKFTGKTPSNSRFTTTPSSSSNKSNLTGFEDIGAKALANKEKRDTFNTGVKQGLTDSQAMTLAGISGGSLYSNNKPLNTNLNNNLIDFEKDDKYINLQSNYDDLNKKYQDLESRYNTLSNMPKYEPYESKFTTPDPYKNTYQAEIAKTLTQLQNYPEFKFDAQNPALLQSQKQAIEQAREQSAKRGRVFDTFAQIKEQEAAQQLLPQFYGQARQDYQTGRANVLSTLGALSGQEQTDYGRYVDSLNQGIKQEQTDYNRYLDSIELGQQQREEQRATEAEQGVLGGDLYSRLTPEQQAYYQSLGNVEGGFATALQQVPLGSRDYAILSYLRNQKIRGDEDIMRQYGDTIDTVGERAYGTQQIQAQEQMAQDFASRIANQWDMDYQQAINDIIASGNRQDEWMIPILRDEQLRKIAAIEGEAAAEQEAIRQQAEDFIIRFGYVPKQYEDVLGVPAGTQTMDYLKMKETERKNKASEGLDWAKENRLKQQFDADYEKQPDGSYVKKVDPKDEKPPLSQTDAYNILTKSPQIVVEDYRGKKTINKDLQKETLIGMALGGEISEGTADYLERVLAISVSDKDIQDYIKKQGG